MAPFSIACCVLNDVYREAGPVPVDGVVVEAGGAFDSDTWATASITYDVAVDTSADDAAVARLLEEVDTVAEIPRVVRGEVTVGRR